MSSKQKQAKNQLPNIFGIVVPKKSWKYPVGEFRPRLSKKDCSFEVRFDEKYLDVVNDMIKYFNDQIECFAFHVKDGNKIMFDLRDRFDPDWVKQMTKNDSNIKKNLNLRKRERNDRRRI